MTRNLLPESRCDLARELGDVAVLDAPRARDVDHEFLSDQPGGNRTTRSPRRTASRTLWVTNGWPAGG
jgi:hypothetical protein